MSTAKPDLAHLPDSKFRKSSRSGGGNDCVQVAMVDGHVAVRDSNDPARTTLVFTPAEWQAFTGGVRDGEFDL